MIVLYLAVTCSAFVNLKLFLAVMFRTFNCRQSENQFSNKDKNIFELAKIKIPKLVSVYP